MPPSQPRKELCPQIRSRICELKRVGFTYKQIHEWYPDIPFGTITTTILREKKRINNVSVPRSGRPRVFTDAQRDHIWETTKNNPHIKLRDLLGDVSEFDQASMRSLQRLLHDMGKRKWRQLKCPEIKPCHAAKHLEQAQKYAYFIPKD
jgi:hypothetical protein